MEKKKTDYKMLAGLIILAAVLAAVVGLFWREVSRRAQEEMRQEEAEAAEEEANAISAIYVETDGPLTMQVFVDLKNGTIFTAPVPEEGIYNKNGSLEKNAVLETGDTVKIYGNGIMTMSMPGQYNGVTRMERTGRVSLEETQEYLDMVNDCFKPE